MNKILMFHPSMLTCTHPKSLQFAIKYICKNILIFYYMFTVVPYKIILQLIRMVVNTYMMKFNRDHFVYKGCFMTDASSRKCIQQSNIFCNKIIAQIFQCTINHTVLKRYLIIFYYSKATNHIKSLHFQWHNFMWCPFHILLPFVGYKKLWEKIIKQMLFDLTSTWHSIS